MAVQSIGRAQALPIALAAIPSPPRPVLARLVTRMIDRLDELDGDPDLELNGDEEDGSFGAEDEFMLHSVVIPAAGCPLADPGGGDVDDEGELDTTYDFGGTGWLTDQDRRNVRAMGRRARQVRRRRGAA